MISRSRQVGYGVQAKGQDSVDATIARLLSDTTISRKILTVFLDLVAFFDKEKLELPLAVSEAAKRCALSSFKGDLHQPVPAIVLWYAEQETAEDMTAQNLANLVEVNIRSVSSYVMTGLEPDV